MKTNRAVWVVALGVSLASPSLLCAQDASTIEIIRRLEKKIDDLEQKVQALQNSKENATTTNDVQSRQNIERLDQKVKVLERERELDQEAQSEKNKAAPTVSLGLNGLVVRSADSNFLMNVHGYAQADGRFYMNQHNP